MPTHVSSEIKILYYGWYWLSICKWVSAPHTDLVQSERIKQRFCDGSMQTLALSCCSELKAQTQKQLVQSKNGQKTGVNIVVVHREQLSMYPQWRIRKKLWQTLKNFILILVTDNVTGCCLYCSNMSCFLMFPSLLLFTVYILQRSMPWCCLCR